MQKWKRVSRAQPCPICKKPDWCLLAMDGGAAICSRIESAKPIGRSGAGWLHPLRTDDWQRPTWRMPRKTEAVPAANMQELAKANCTEIRPESLGWLSKNLGVTVDSLVRLRVGWSSQWRAFSFPMRYPNGNVAGIRLRKFDGGKFAEPGSKDGMFFRPTDILTDYLIIVEGASDCAAVMDLGFASVVGRSSCRGNVDQIVTLFRRRRPKRIVILPDNDGPGVSGAHQLRVNIELAGAAVSILNLPVDIKDCRQAIQSTKNAEWLATELGKLCGIQPQRKDADCAIDIPE